MDLKTIIAVAPFLRRLYRKLPRPLRILAVLLALVMGVMKLFRGRGEEPVAEGTHEAGGQAGEQTG
ncbi:MAG: hypothetical protein M3N32_08615 [Actinomycetota bacterium]|nr:hypothetical protein [Actinomycetota bacterium]